MLTATQIYKRLEDLSQRHKRLRKKFLEFFELAGDLSTESSPIRGITFDGHLDDNYFNVTFCGQTFQFNFSLSLDQNGASRGTVSCFGADPIDVSKRKLITAFSYSGTGATDVQRPEDIEDQITIDSDVGASSSYVTAFTMALRSRSLIRQLDLRDPDRGASRAQ